jgi:hypothetical protein
MADGKVEVHIERTPEDVWAVISDFGGLDGWMPGVDGCDLDGDVRTLNTNGMEIKERLVSQDDGARTQSYSIVEGPIPVEHHLATLSVEPDGEGSRFTWAWEVRPDEMEALFSSIYEGSAQAVKDQLES